MRKERERDAAYERGVRAVRALTAPQRLRILRLIRRHQPISALELAKRLTPPAPASTVSTHLGILVKEGFVRATRTGQAVAYALDETGFQMVEHLLRSLTDT